MFSDLIEHELKSLAIALDFESAAFVFEPKDVLSELAGTQIVGFLNDKIDINQENNTKEGFAFADLSIIVLVPSNYIVDAVMLNVYSFLKDARIKSIETDSNKIYNRIYAKDITSDARLIMFNCEMVIRVMKVDCCIEMIEAC